MRRYGILGDVVFYVFPLAMVNGPDSTRFFPSVPPSFCSYKVMEVGCFSTPGERGGFSISNTKQEGLAWTVLFGPLVTVLLGSFL